MTCVFDKRAKDYDAWFDEHPAIYLSELEALRRVASKGGLEIGVGTGRFALPLGTAVGLDPSRPMLQIARGKGLEVVRGIAEKLPFRDGSFAQVLMVTTLCFISDPLRAIAEARRVTHAGGRLVIGMLDDGSAVGHGYLERVKGSSFYQDARFLSADNVLGMLKEADWSPSAVFQTIFRDPSEMIAQDFALPGHGKGAFVVISAINNCQEGKPRTF
jgi:ubiquinone/menaquinone biosynthesis C-methylase UbiE